MSDEEVVCHKNDLCKHLNELGYVDFETYTSNELLDNVIGNSLPMTSLKNNSPEPELRPIDSCSHDKIMSLLRSKLMFLDDVKFVESVLSPCYICDEKPTKYMLGAVATSFVSIAAYFSRGIDSFLPISCIAMSTIYAAWRIYKNVSELNKNKLLAQYVKSLQNLCIDFHKVLRYLKEVEILSTGQVSTQNVGSAMYISVNSVNGNELKKLPPWKTLPELRKSVANSLIEIINMFSCGYDFVRKHSPSWIDIKGFSTISQVPLNQINVMFEDINACDVCISMKDLQMLNDSYLLAQSEFLKWVAFYLCPAVWNYSKDNFSSFTNEILIEYLENTQTKICDISSKLKLSFNMQKIFTCPAVSKTPLQNMYTDNDKTQSSVDINELKMLQRELHKIFLLVLSTVQKAKSLEDCLDTFSNKITGENYIPIDDLKENLLQQLSMVRNDLEKVVEDYDYIYSQVIRKNKSASHEEGDLVTENTAYQLQNFNQERVKVGYSDFAVSSPDEVFLALSGSKPEDFEINSDDWCLDKKPKIPQTLLTELSKTLKPIKKEFEERERLVLQNLGIQDIEDKEDENSILNKNVPSKLNTDSKPCFDETQTEGDSEFTESCCVQNEPASSVNSILMADLLKMNLLAQHRQNFEEECFSND